MEIYVNVNKKYKYRVPQEDMSIFWEIIISAILRKIIYVQGC
jgi:hypothetical protein